VLDQVFLEYQRVFGKTPKELPLQLGGPAEFEGVSVDV
jgi:hypothetical protein